jgi:hypothetical protein
MKSQNGVFSNNCPWPLSVRKRKKREKKRPRKKMKARKK